MEKLNIRYCIQTNLKVSIFDKIKDGRSQKWYMCWEFLEWFYQCGEVDITQVYPSDEDIQKIESVCDRMFIESVRTQNLLQRSKSKLIKTVQFE